jgi:hypothetical protein
VPAIKNILMVGAPERLNGRYRQERGLFGISPHHYEPGTWYESALRSNAKIISVVGEGTEIEHYFLRQNGKFRRMSSEYHSLCEPSLLVHEDYYQALRNVRTAELISSHP